MNMVIIIYNHADIRSFTIWIKDYRIWPRCISIIFCIGIIHVCSCVINKDSSCSCYIAIICCCNRNTSCCCVKTYSWTSCKCLRICCSTCIVTVISESCICVIWIFISRPTSICSNLIQLIFIKVNLIIISIINCSRIRNKCIWCSNCKIPENNSIF